MGNSKRKHVSVCLTNATVMKEVILGRQLLDNLRELYQQKHFCSANSDSDDRHY